MHLTYCLNVHPGETWGDALQVIREKTLTVKKAVAPDKPFGLGLRISHQASLELSDPARLRETKHFFDEHQLYAFTINGFPYGNFHQTSVKENVYRPDWQTVERRDYTIRLANILAALLPDGVDGSISTVPVSFKPWIKDDAALDRVSALLLDCAMHLHKIHEQTGKLIHLGLEPEPCCYLETTDECIDFFNNVLLRRNAKYEEIIRRHIGVCLDTCHVAIQFENPVEVLKKYERHGLLISKIQLSAALECLPEHVAALQAFAEPVYLHQVKARTLDGKILSWPDIPASFGDLKNVETLRVHFHVPLFWPGDRSLRSTAVSLTDEFWRKVAASSTNHLEIETYTFDVFPDALRTSDIETSIVQEYTWVLKKEPLWGLSTKI